MARHANLFARRQIRLHLFVLQPETTCHVAITDRRESEQESRSARTCATADGQQVWFTLKDIGKTQVFDAKPPST